MTAESHESPPPAHAAPELASGGAPLLAAVGGARGGGGGGRAGLGVAQDPLMSARHFAIRCERDHCRLRDLGSTNGTFVNGSNIPEATLHDGDRIVAGQSTFVVRLCREPTPVASVLP